MPLIVVGTVIGLPVPPAAAAAGTAPAGAVPLGTAPTGAMLSGAVAAAAPTPVGAVPPGAAPAAANGGTVPSGPVRAAASPPGTGTGPALALVAVPVPAGVLLPLPIAGGTGPAAVPAVTFSAAFGTVAVGPTADVAFGPVALGCAGLGPGVPGTSLPLPGARGRTGGTAATGATLPPGDTPPFAVALAAPASAVLFPPSGAPVLLLLPAAQWVAESPSQSMLVKSLQ